VKSEEIELSLSVIKDRGEGRPEAGEGKRQRTDEGSFSL
jgi:hypothetical protein